MVVLGGSILGRSFSYRHDLTNGYKKCARNRFSLRIQKPINPSPGLARAFAMSLSYVSNLGELGARQVKGFILAGFGRVASAFVIFFAVFSINSS